MILGDGLSALGLFYILLCLLRGEAGLVNICIGVMVSSVFGGITDEVFGNYPDFMD